MPDSSQSARTQIANMNWDDFKSYLEPSTRAQGGASRADEQALRDYFGAQEYKELVELAAQAQRSRTRGDSPVPQGNVILIPGIMGSNLASVNGSISDTIWVSLWNIAKGQVGKLLLADDNRHGQIAATVVDKRTYTRALIRLGARWNIKPFAFDWRKDIKTAAESLNDFINREFKDQPVHLVAHSMGGLVSRYFIHLFPDTWARMRGDGKQGGRLIMLGTPNYGSFSIPQVMTGAETLVRWLARLDLSHNLQEILGIINSFAGSYQMLPAPSKLTEETRVIYERETWGTFSSSISPQYLDRAEKFHGELASSAATIDPDRMTYIAGCNRRTLSGLTVLDPGEFQYDVTTDGDGRVPHTLGRLEGVTTYYVDEDHGSLPKNDKVITAVEQILGTGHTAILSDRPATARGIMPTETRWRRSIAEHYTARDLHEIAIRARDNVATPDEIRAAEQAMMRAVMSEDRPERDVAQLKRSQPEKNGLKKAKKPPLAIEVIYGDITEVTAPVVVVGQYKGVAPVNAVGALDTALGYWISQANSRSMIGAELGQLFFIPSKRGQIHADSVLLAGMGEEGRFSQDDLRYLMTNVTYAISALDKDSFATVLIGAGAGNLSEMHAIRAMLFGICEALFNLHRDLQEKQSQLRLRRVRIIENNKERAKRIANVLEKIQSQEPAVNFRIKVTRNIPDTEKKPVTAPKMRMQSPPEQPVSEFYPRITIEHAGDVFRFSALTREAVIPVREVEIQSFFSEGIAERLINSSTQEEQVQLGRLLQHHFPEDFQQLFNLNTPLSLILDNTTASFPWEMACFARPEGDAFFGTHLKLARQFRTMLSSAPRVTLPAGKSLRVLVIADPAPEKELQLAGARREGRAVTKVLNQIRHTHNLAIEVVDRIGSDECDPIQLLALILDGNFDVIHYAGHGFFDKDKPSHGGWVFGRNVQLTAREIFRLRRAPRLIFANACFSAVVNKKTVTAEQPVLTAEQMNRNLAGIAEAFFERGVPNYLGAGWPVADDTAVRFAMDFYSYALTGAPYEGAADDHDLDESANEPPPDGRSTPSAVGPMPFGEAISEARKRILHEGSTWGAYQHYGHANYRLMSPPSASGARGGGAKAPAAARPTATRKKTGAKKSTVKKTSARKSGTKKGR